MSLKVIDPEKVMGGRVLMLLVGLVGVFGIAELYEGATTFSYKGINRYGGWYAGVSAIGTAAYFTLRSEGPINRLYMAGCMTIVLSLIATFVDGLGWSYVNSFQACTSSSLVSSGNADYYPASLDCQHNFEADCTCVSEKLSSDPECYLIDGTSLDTCGGLLNTFPSMIQTCFAFDLCILAFTMLLLVLLSQITTVVRDKNYRTGGDGSREGDAEQGRGTLRNKSIHEMRDATKTSGKSSSSSSASAAVATVVTPMSAMK